MILFFKRWWNEGPKIWNILLLIAGFALIIVIIGGYVFDWTWVGFGTYISPPYDIHKQFQREKTLWDWMQLLIIPLVLALGALWFNWQQNKNDREIALDKQREEILEAYLDRISALMLDYQLRDSHPGSQIREVAHVRTLTALRKLDPLRKAALLKFLQDARLILGEKAILELDGADLTKVDLRRIHLEGANLSNANLSNTDLRESYLSLVTMQSTNLMGADLSGANLTGADLRKANLQDANLIGADLHEVNLDGANLVNAKVENSRLMEAASLKDVSGIHPLETGQDH